MSMLNGSLDGAKHWVEGVPFDIYKSSELFDLDELHKKIADFNNAAETVVYLPSDASAKVPVIFTLMEIIDRSCSTQPMGNGCN